MCFVICFLLDCAGIIVELLSNYLYVDVISLGEVAANLESCLCLDWFVFWFVCFGMIVY